MTVTEYFATNVFSFISLIYFFLFLNKKNSSTNILSRKNHMAFEKLKYLGQTINSKTHFEIILAQKSIQIYPVSFHPQNYV